MLHKLTLIFLISTFAQFVHLFSNSIAPETVWPSAITTIVNDTSQLLVYSVEIYAGSRVQVFQKTNLMVDLNFKKTIIADKAKISWGVNCEAPDCIKCGDEEFGQFRTFAYKYLPAKGVFGLDSRFDLNDTQTLARLNFDFLQEIPDNWPFNGLGVIGMSPDSDFLNYLNNNFGDVSVTMHFMPNHSEELGHSPVNLQVYLNHEETQIITNHRIKLQDRWVLDGYIEASQASGNIQLNFQDTFIVSFLGAKKFCDAQIALACPKDEKCSAENINIHQAQKFKFRIQNTDYFVYPEEYLQFVKTGDLECLMREFQPDDSSIDCFAQIGLGYMVTHTPVYSIKKGVAYIGFLRFFDIPDDYSWLWPLVGVFAALAVILLGAIMYINRKRSQMSDDYVNFES
jgi:hypothetical protein